MKKILAVICVIVFLLSSTIVFAEKQKNVNQVNIKYSFDKPEISKTTIDNKEYDQVKLKDTTCFGNPGEPFIPMKGAYILLPMNTKVLDIKINIDNPVSLGSGFNLEPVGKLVTKPNLVSKPIDLDKKIYSTDDFYPENLYDKIGVYSFRGYNILVLNLYPVQYNPVSGEIIYHSYIDITVDTIEKQTKNNNFRDNKKDKEELIKKIDNPDLVNTYNADESSLKKLDDQYDLLILTNKDLQNSFQPLKNAHEEKGLRVEIKTLSDISLAPGSVTPEDIRNFVRSEYQNNGIDYLLLGGDTEIIPDKLLYVSGYDENKWFYDALMPVDQYYGYLDGPFNNDGDELWGETNDGENGGDVDLLAEVYVGRACVDNIDDANNFVQKTIKYLEYSYEEKYLKNVLLAGEYLGEHGVSSYAGNLLDALIDGSSRDNFTTKGIPSDVYQIDTLYDRDYQDTGGWTSQDLLNKANQNIHFLIHDGHSYYGYNMKMTNNEVSSFTNDKPFFAYSVGCMAGGFDNPDDYDCFAEYMTVKTENAAFSGIWNARYGFFWSGRTDGDGSMYSRQFWDAVYKENIPNIAKANQDSKEDNLHLLTRSMMRWTNYQLNLFGDPSLSFHISYPPETPETPEGPNSGKPDEKYSYSTTTTDPEGEQIFYMFDWGDGSDSGWLGPYQSGTQMISNHTFTSRGSYNIRVKAKNTHGMESGWSEPLDINIGKNRNRFKDNTILEIIREIIKNMKNRIIG